MPADVIPPDDTHTPRGPDQRRQAPVLTISEVTVRDAELLGVDGINAVDGVPGKRPRRMFAVQCCDAPGSVVRVRPSRRVV